MSHLDSCKTSFVPPLDAYVNIEEYSQKIRDKAITFEAWSDNRLIGLIAAYLNLEKMHGYITNVSIDPLFQEKGIAKELLSRCVGHLKAKQVSEIDLEVKKENTKAQEFYSKYGFETTEVIEKIKMKYKTR